MAMYAISGSGRLRWLMGGLGGPVAGYHVQNA